MAKRENWGGKPAPRAIRVPSGDGAVAGPAMRYGAPRAGSEPRVDSSNRPRPPSQPCQPRLSPIHSPSLMYSPSSTRPPPGPAPVSSRRPASHVCVVQADTQLCRQVRIPTTNCAPSPLIAVHASLATALVALSAECMCVLPKSLPTRAYTHSIFRLFGGESLLAVGPSSTIERLLVMVGQLAHYFHRCFHKDRLLLRSIVSSGFPFPTSNLL